MSWIGAPSRLVTAIALTGSLCAAQHSPLPAIGLKVEGWLLLRPDLLPPAWQEPLYGVTVTRLTIEREDQRLQVARHHATELMVIPVAKGTFPAWLVVEGHGTDGVGKSARIPLTFVGYEIDRTRVNDLSAADPGYSARGDGLEPFIGRAVIGMDPFIPQVHWTMTMFAHDSTFEGGARTFSVSTSGGQTSLGTPGWQPIAGTTRGELTFDIIIPPYEQSYCLKTESVPVLPDPDSLTVAQLLGLRADN
jgi:hypothetical protein